MEDELNLTGDGGVLNRIITEAKIDAIGPTNDLPPVDGFVIKGFDITLKTIKVGEIATITCKPKYANGSADAPKVPENPITGVDMEVLRQHIANGLKRWKELQHTREEVNNRIKDEQELGVDYDLTGDGGILEKYIWKVRANAIGPTADLLIVDGIQDFPLPLVIR